jgi:4-diphosphocytidyl-2-C-methyl-D-erythritol kinase
MTTRPLRVRAHAKINLVLRVGAVRPDGYHALETVFQSLALHDTLTIAARRGPFVLTCSDPGVPVDARNLVWRAASRLWSALGRRGAPRDVAIAIAKHIPMQAGLGGGSSDAAAALLALCRLWAPGRGQPVDLAAIGGEIGADVPYFLQGGTAVGLSRGDELFPLQDMSPYWVVLALPAFGVSTSEAYRWLDEDRASGGAKGRRSAVGAAKAGAGPPAIAAWPGLRLAIVNDLEAPVFRRHPGVRDARDLLAQAGAVSAAMTGSGSGVFGLFESERRAERAARAAASSGAVALVTRTVDRETCQRVHFSFASSPPRHA